MEDKRLKDLFSGFQPEMSSSFQFMAKLQKNLEAVEIVRRHNAALRKRNRVAVGIAAACGFVAGVALTLLFPLLGDWMSAFNISLPYLRVNSLTVDCSFIAWIIITAVSVITSLNVYEIAMTKLSHPHRSSHQNP